VVPERAQARVPPQARSAPRFAVSRQDAEPAGELPALRRLEARPPALVPAREPEPERPEARPVQREVRRTSDRSLTAAR